MLQDRFHPDSTLQTGEHSVTCLGIGRGGVSDSESQYLGFGGAATERPCKAPGASQMTDQFTELLGCLLGLPFLLLDLEDLCPGDSLHADPACKDKREDDGRDTGLEHET